MRVVADTNVLVSAQLSNTGSAADFWRLWHADKFELVTSPFILKETETVLSRSKIYKTYHLSILDRKNIIDIFRRQSTVVYPLEIKPVINFDHSDNHILAAALTGKANFIVSGDKHLLILKNYQKIPILSLKKFISLF